MSRVPDLSRRALPHDLPELMDQPCSFEELQGCLRDIARVNRLTLAHRPTLSWLQELSTHAPVDRPLRIVDVGCGYGDALRRISRWASRRGLPVHLTGIDLNADAIRAAQSTPSQGKQIQWVHGDAFSLDSAQIDVVISSLLTHHLEEAEIVRFLQWMESTARLGWFINDLHRTALPYRAFSLLVKVFPFHPFVRHDGLVSIQRSFLRDDWTHLLRVAGLASGFEIREYRPARLCVSRIKTPLMEPYTPNSRMLKEPYTQP